MIPFVTNAQKVSYAENQRLMVFPVVFTSLLFAAFHTMNPYGFAFIFSAGCVLALIYFLTGSLWCSMWGHFLYNGSQILAVFYGTRNSGVKQMIESNNIPLIYPLIGLILFVGCFYLLVKSQTPLPPDWSDDFKGEFIKPEQSTL
jgi:membrane protease YdiL (CAAX protease family)